jgi:hypothetical protein
MNHLSEEQLVLYHYGDADNAEAGAIEQHLHSCASCQADLDGIRRTLVAVDGLATPTRTDAYGAEVWARVQPSLDEAAGSWWDRVQSFLVPRRLALGGAVAIVLMAAFVAGRFLPTGQPPASPAAPQAPAASPQQAAADRELVRERILLVAVGDHLERSQIALVELVNSPSGPTVDISGERERVRDLVAENHLYRQAAVATGDPGVVSVLDDLERVLLEIANSPSTMTADEFGRVRKRIEQQGIIFKVRVFGDSVREREYQSAANVGIRG